MYPEFRTPENLWHVRVRALIFIVLKITGLIVLPIIAFIYAIKNRDSDSICFLWNIVAFFNTIFLSVVIMKGTSVKIVNLIRNPQYPTGDSNLNIPSFVIADCPTR